MVAAGQAKLIDIREVDEWQEGHVPGSINLPLSDMAGLMAGLVSDQPNYLLCRSGNRSARAASWLTERGYDVVNVQDGIIAWPTPLVK